MFSPIFTPIFSTWNKSKCLSEARWPGSRPYPARVTCKAGPSFDDCWNAYNWEPWKQASCAYKPSMYVCIYRSATESLMSNPGQSFYWWRATNMSSAAYLKTVRTNAPSHNRERGANIRQKWGNIIRQSITVPLQLSSNNLVDRSAPLVLVTIEVQIGRDQRAA